jgi:hypothetical protein
MVGVDTAAGVPLTDMLLDIDHMTLVPSTLYRHDYRANPSNIVPRL